MILAFITSLIELFNKILEIEWHKLTDFGEYSLWWLRRDGLYEVLEHQATLELKDKFGKKAIYHKYQVVKFLQNNITTYQDKAWGDGNIFADYRCSTGKAVDRYREGLFYWVLISLRETKQRGDIEHFHIERVIERGFTKKEEDWQTDIDHCTRKLSISIIFPPARHPKRVALLQQSIKKTMDLQTTNYISLPDGRTEVKWETNKARKHEVYILRWWW